MQQDSEVKNIPNSEFRASIHEAIKFFPFFAVVLIFLGFIKSYFYYIQFGIRILPFLEFSEIITSFLDFLTYSAIVVILIVLMNFSLRGNKKDSGIGERQKPYNRTLVVAITVLVTGSMTILLINWIWGWMFRTLSLMLLLFMISLYSFFASWINFSRRNFQKNARGIIGIGLFSIGLITLTFSAASYQCLIVKEAHRYSGSKIYLNDGTVIISNDTTYYIGKTNGYLFIYDSRKFATDVVPMEHVKKLTISASRNWFLGTWY